MSAPMKHEDFQPHLGRPFRFRGFPHALTLARIDVKDGPPLPGLSYKAFTLIFRDRAAR